MSRARARSVLTATWILNSAGGTIGTLLLDPRNITIASGGGDLGGAGSFGSGAATDVTIDPAALDAVAANVVLQANNDITIASAVNLSTAGASLTAQAGRSILINSSITTHGGAITLVANDTAADGVVDADRLAGDAVIKMASGASLGSNGGNISLTINTGAGLTNSTAGSMTVAGIYAGSGNVTLINDGGGIGFAAGTVSAGSLAVSANGNVSLQTVITQLAASSVNGALSIDNGNTSLTVAGNISAGSVSLSAGTGALATLATVSAGSVSLTANSLSLGAAVTGSRVH